MPAYGPDDTVAVGDGKPPKPAALSLLWALEAGGAGEDGRLWAGTIPGGLFRSDDRGDSWQLVRSLWDRPERERWFGGGYDAPGIHSICVDPRDAAALRGDLVRRRVAQHRQRRDLGGDQRRHVRDFMPPELAGDPAIQDPHRMVQCAGRA